MNRVHVRGKQVGWVENDIFYKRIHGSKHFLRKPPAIAFDRISIMSAIEYGALKVRVLDVETDVVYSTTMRDLEDNGFNINRGHGEQIAMGMKRWKAECRICAVEGASHCL
jgi:hypothetical protein|tara:strand:+ start:264 stop:596 length:333 start_codon:yes stop_codon:yes gene_type:complete